MAAIVPDLRLHDERQDEKNCENAVHASGIVRR